MDRASGFDDSSIDDHAIDDATDAGVGEVDLDIGGDERRMHVRAYNHWVSLLRGRPYPGMDDLDPANIADFGPHSVLLDFTGGVEDPAIRFLGRLLREECGLDNAIARISQVPSRSLLSRLTDHYLQIIANRSPIGFEAEFVNTRGRTTLYRGILMPFSSDGAAIDFIYGVINWKELADPATQAAITAELAAARAPAPLAAPAWADGPGASAAVAAEAPNALDEQLAMARESVAAAYAADTRSRAALYRALGRAHAFAVASEDDPDSYKRLLADAGITGQARAPLTPLVKLIFGADYDKTRVTEFAAVLGAARAAAVPAGALPDFIDSHPGGIKGVVKAARDARRRAPLTPPDATDRAPIARVMLDVAGQPGDMIVLVARKAADGVVDVLGAIAGDAALSRRALAALR